MAHGTNATSVGGTDWVVLEARAKKKEEKRKARRLRARFWGAPWLAMKHRDVLVSKEYAVRRLRVRKIACALTGGGLKARRKAVNRLTKKGITCCYA